MKFILLIVYPLCSVFIIVGAILAVSTLRSIVKARSISGWPSVDADVSKCEFKKFTGDNEQADSFEVVVSYHYMVNGKKYEGNKIHPAYSESSFDGHRKLYERMKNAAVVRARYNVLDPQEAYLVTGNYSAHLATFFGGMIFLTSGVMFLLCFHFALTGNSDYSTGLDIIQTRKAGAEAKPGL